MRISMLKDFDATTEKLLALISTTEESQLNELPFSGSWTAGQVADHLLKSYAVVTTLRGRTEPTRRSPDQKLGEVRKLFLDFSIKMESPKAIVPSEEPIIQREILAALKRRIDQLREVILHDDLSVICKDYAIPEYGEFTRMEWIGFTIIHTQRHIYQLEKICEKVKAR